MFKDLLIKWVTDLIDKFAAVGQNSYLSIGLSAFNNTLYGWVHTIMTSVVMPIAYVILALFFVLELYKASIKVDGAGGGSSFGAEIVFRVMFKMVLCKVAVDSSLLFMQAIYSVAQAVVTGIAGVVVNGSVSGAVDLAAMTAQINAMSLGDQIGMLLELVIVKFGVWVLLGLVQIICIARFIEIYVYIAISPIPIATFPSDDLNQIAKGFLKSFAAVCLQGAFIYLILSFFPILVSSNILPMYDKVYTGKLPAGKNLDDLFTEFNINRPADFTGHSLSVSDIIAIKEEFGITAYYVDSFGFENLPEFAQDIEDLQQEADVASFEKYQGISSEEARRHEEMLDTVRFDGDIDLDREKTREQLGFRDQNKEQPKAAQEPQKKISMKERMAAAQAEADRRNSSHALNQPQRDKTAERGK